MPEIKGFKGIRYNPDKINKFAEVITQPYDQISDDMEKDYQHRSPYNFVNLVLTKYSEGHDRPREYEKAKRSLETWRKDKIFIQDGEEAIYPYLQEFKVNNRRYVRKGFFTAVRLEELGKGGILPHEKTLSKPKEDRLSLTRKTKKDLEPVFLLYTDVQNFVDDLMEKFRPQKPLIDVTDDSGVNHKLWQIVDPNVIGKIADHLCPSTFVIADGHHRYETFYTYSRETADLPPNHPAKFKMVVLVNIQDPGLVILPTHRLIKNLPKIGIECLVDEAQEYFSIRKVKKSDIGSELEKEKVHAFGVYSPGGSYVWKLKSMKIMEKLLPDKSDVYRKLDTAILQAVLIEKILGIRPEQIEDHVRYERGIEPTLQKVDNNEFQFAFLLNPTRPDQVRDVASNQERMPQKSTDFFPKLISGLVFYDIA
jgi:uncharacterized protein (DUF1015 family)